MKGITKEPTNGVFKKRIIPTQHKKISTNLSQAPKNFKNTTF